MTTPTLTAPPALTPNKYGGDPVAFDAAMQAWLTWEATRQPEEVTLVSWVDAEALAIAAQANAAQSDRILCDADLAAITAQSPVSNAAAAAASAAAAAAYATQALATNPDAPIRLNPRQITANVTIPSAYNAQSTGPITISEGIIVTVQDNATWSIC